jgi:hypothetical protein
MKRTTILLLILVSMAPAVANAARSTASTFRVGIEIAHDCTAARAPDGAAVSLACSGKAIASQRTTTAGQAWPRAARRVDGAPMRVQDVAEGDAMRLVIVEF